MYRSYNELGMDSNKVSKDPVLEISSLSHKQQLISQHRVVLVEIYASWCGPCRHIFPSYSVLASRYNKPGLCIVVKEDLDKKITPGIGGVPTFHFYVDGNKVDEVIGANIDEVETKLKNIMTSLPSRLQHHPHCPQHGHVHHSQSQPTTPQIPQYHRNAVRNSLPVFHGQNTIEPSSSPLEDRPFNPPSTGDGNIDIQYF